MPNLDGVSATHLVRQFDQTTPIIAMTSNIRSDDIHMYFQHGMNDVLPKPFTKEGLLAMLEKHLQHLKKQPVGLDHMPPPLNSAKRSLKSEDSPATSPATASNWNSPNQLVGGSPGGNGLADDPYIGSAPYVQPGMPIGQVYATAPPGALAMPPRPGPPMVGAPQRRGIADISGGPEMVGDGKRPMYGPGPGMGQMPPQMPPQLQRPPR